MASYPHSASSNKPKPWPAYFIVRTTGEVVPLIGVDELPIGVDLVGVPRALDLEDTIGMLNLGIQRNSDTYYQILQPEETKADIHKTAAKLVSLELEAKSKAAEAWQQTSAQYSLRSATSSKTSTNSHPATSINPSTQTHICRHWCTHGICKWGQQCRYRHIMPMTLPGLQEIGLKDWPHWYRALNPGYFASEPVHLKPNFGRRGRGRVCPGRNGCCGDINPAVGITHARAERLKAAAKAERARKEDLEERTLERLSGVTKEVKEIKGGSEKGVSRSVMLERAQVNDVRDWEEGSEVAEESTGKEKVVEGRKTSVGKTSLLD